MNKIKDVNYFVVHGWMITRLGLKGTDLLVYAVIYGFSQDGDTEFTGTLQYLCDFCGGVSKPTIIASLKRLTETGLIRKTERSVNGVIFNSYSADVKNDEKNLTGGKEILLGVKNFNDFDAEPVKNFNWGGKEILPPIPYIKNNIEKGYDYNKKEITKERTEKFEDEFEVLWKQYPRKEGKKEARTAYIGARKKRTTIEEVQEGLQRYLDKIQREHTEPRYIKKGSSWFRGYCWEDEYTSDNTGGRFKTGRRPITELDPNNAWDAAELKQRLAEGEQLPKGANL